jgi:hypothetical protein
MNVEQGISNIELKYFVILLFLVRSSIFSKGCNVTTFCPIAGKGFLINFSKIYLQQFFLGRKIDRRNFRKPLKKFISKAPNFNVFIPASPAQLTKPL